MSDLRSIIDYCEGDLALVTWTDLELIRAAVRKEMMRRNPALTLFNESTVGKELALMEREPCPDCSHVHAGPCQPVERELPDPEDEDPTPSRRNTP